MRNQYEVSVRQRETFDALRDSLQRVFDDADLNAGPLGISIKEDALAHESPLKDVLGPISERLKSFHSNVQSLVEQRRADVQEFIRLLDNTRESIDASFDRFNSDYKSRVDTLTPEQQRLLNSHQKVLEETKALPRLQQDAATQRAEVEALLAEMSNLSTQVAELLDQRTELRKARAGELNRQLVTYHVQLSVEPMTVRLGLDALSQKYNVGARIYQELTSAGPASRHHRRLAQAYDRLRNDLIGGSHPFFDTAEFLYFLDYFEEDDLKIRFKVGKEGEEFSPIDQLSAGQRCTAIFPLLLKLQEGPLILDQPEDNLDNRHIADVIAPALQTDKAGRQIVITSHNANLVVLTDAEHIAAFEASGSEGRIEARGFLSTSRSAITKHVLSILDGGERALQLRYRKYGVLGAST